MGPIRRQAFDGGHGLTDRGPDRHAARTHRSTVNVHGAGPALSDATAEFGASEPKLITDHPEQRSVRRYVHGMPHSIDGKVYCHECKVYCHESTFRSQTGQSWQPQAILGRADGFDQDAAV